MNSVDEL